MNRLKNSIVAGYIAAWEAFAGKPYVKPAKLEPGVIKDTVNDAQDLLYSLHNGAIVRWLSDYYTRKTARREAQYPQSLGELCLEVAQSWIRKEAQTGWAVPKELFDYYPEVRRDTDSLRQALYRRDPLAGETK